MTVKAGVAVLTTPSPEVPSVSETAIVPAVDGTVVSIVSDPELVESAVVTDLPARSKTFARTLYVVLVVSAAAVTVYGPLPVKVALSVQVDPLVLTCRTTLAIAAVGAFDPVYAVSAVPDAARLNAGVVVLMIPSLPDDPVSVEVMVRVPAVGAVVSTVIRPFVVESAAVEVMPAVSVTRARIE